MKYYIIFLVLLKTVDLNALGEKCESLEDCTNLHEICSSSNTCDCVELSYPNEANDTCLQYTLEYQGSCIQTAQCEFLGANIECNKKKQCACQEEYRWFNGVCVHYGDLGASCTADEECYNNYDLRALKCDKKICTCSDSHYSRNGDCRLLSTTEDGDCAIDLDCGVENVICKVGQCVAASTYKEQSSFNRSESDNVLRDSSDGIDCGNTQCSENTYCKDEQHCVTGLGGCTADTDCITYPNSACFKGTSCICKTGYFFKGGKCIEELGMVSNCKADSDCPIKPGKCVEGVCFCKNYWFNDNKNQNCFKTSISTNWNCLSNEWCNILGPNSYCHMSNDTGSESICTCSSNSALNEDNLYCEKTDDTPEGFCVRDNECGFSETCLNEKCDCQEGYSRNKDGICNPMVGSSCEVEQCIASNSKCEKGVCKCLEGYITEDGLDCYANVNGLNSTCEVSAQCYTSVLNSVCVDKMCLCSEKFKEVSGLCFERKTVGSPCDSTFNCTVVLDDTFECRNNLCQCPIDYKLDGDSCSSGIIANGSYVMILLFTFALFKVFG